MLGRIASTGVALVLCSSLTHAQQGLIGTYEGQYLSSFQGTVDFPTFVTLVIARAENGKLAGKFSILRAVCRGEYTFEGAYKDNMLEMRTDDGSGTMGCGKQTIAVTVQGSRLVGKYANSDIEFSKK